MVLIKSKLRKVPINISKFKKVAQHLLDELGYGDFDVGILLTTDKTIRRYNKQYRNKDKATDVLSFPFYPGHKPDQRIKAKTGEEKNLGDIIISLEHVKRDADRLDISFNERLNQILVHGMCHLIGYTHDTDKGYELMQKKEEQLLASLDNRYS